MIKKNITLSIFLGLIVMFAVLQTANATITVTQPYPNDIITNNIFEVQVTGTSPPCYFNYEQTYNQTITCTGNTSVYIPNKQQNYTLVFGDDDGEITQTITLQPYDSWIVIIFSAAFLIGMLLAITSMIVNISDLTKLAYTPIIVGTSLSSYFIGLIYYYLSTIYFPNPLILNFLIIFIRVGAFTHVLIPLITLVLGLTLGEMKNLEGTAE